MRVNHTKKVSGVSIKAAQKVPSLLLHFENADSGEKLICLYCETKLKKDFKSQLLADLKCLMALKVQTICCNEENDHEIWSDPLCEVVFEIVSNLLKDQKEVTLQLNVGRQMVALKVQPVCDIEMHDHVHVVVLWLDSLCRGEKSGSLHGSEEELGTWFKNQLVNVVSDIYQLKALKVQLACEIMLWLDLLCTAENSGSHSCEAELASFSVLFKNQNEIDSELGSIPLVALKVQPVSDAEVKDHESDSKCGGTQLVVKSVRDITDNHEKMSDCVLNVEKSFSESPKGK